MSSSIEILRNQVAEIEAALEVARNSSNFDEVVRLINEQTEINNRLYEQQLEEIEQQNQLFQQQIQMMMNVPTFF